MLFRSVKLIDVQRVSPAVIKRECDILEVLKHPNVISLKAHSKGCPEVQQDHLYFIAMELAAGGELLDKLTEPMAEPLARTFFNQILDGVNYCHLAGVAHRDLKLENILLNTEGKVKLIDFGLSHMYPRIPDGSIDRSKPLLNACGSRSYAAPEVLAAAGYDGYAADMWSMGVCLFGMLSGFFPLEEASGKDWRYQELIEGQRAGASTTALVHSWYTRRCGHLSPEVIDLLDNLLLVDPKKRFGIEKARAHPWVLDKKLEQTDKGSSSEYRSLGTSSTDTAPSTYVTYRSLSSDANNFKPSTMDDEDMPVCTLPSQ